MCFNVINVLTARPISLFLYLLLNIHRIKKYACRLNFWCAICLVSFSNISTVYHFSFFWAFHIGVRLSHNRLRNVILLSLEYERFLYFFRGWIYVVLRVVFQVAKVVFGWLCIQRLARATIQSSGYTLPKRNISTKI